MEYGEQILQLSIHRLHDAGGRLVKKEGFWWIVLHWAVFFVTFGTNRSFLTGYSTTIGRTVGVPRNWEQWGEVGRAALIEHETVHVKQSKKYSFPLFAFLYLLAPLPLGFAWFRWRFEREAYAHGIRFALSYGGWEGQREALIGGAVSAMASGQYAWTMPFKGHVRRYFEKVVPA